MGNQTIEKVTRNALAVVRVAGITGVPFAAGCARPLVREIETGSSTHGESGLDGPCHFPYSSGRFPYSSAQLIQAIDDFALFSLGEPSAVARRRRDDSRASRPARCQL